MLFCCRLGFFLDRGNAALLYEKERHLAGLILVGCRGKRFNLVRRGYHANISHCPETRRRANGWSRQGRIKALPNVAVPEYGTLRCVEPKLSPGGLRNRVCITWFSSDRPCGVLAPRGVLLFRAISDGMGSRVMGIRAFMIREARGVALDVVRMAGSDAASGGDGRALRLRAGQFPPRPIPGRDQLDAARSPALEHSHPVHGGRSRPPFFPC